MTREVSVAETAFKGGGMDNGHGHCMWFLSPFNNSTQTADRLGNVLVPASSLTVGRKGADLGFADKSVSRHHATFIMEAVSIEDATNLEHRPKVVLKDNGSKYGTFVNGISAIDSMELKENDMVRLGSFQTTVQLVWKPCVVCRSSLNSADKKELFHAAVQWGFKVSKEWTPQCTHFYTQEIQWTDKLIKCLASACPVVSSAWLPHIVASFSPDPPSSIDYVPSLSAEFPIHLGVDLSPQPMRSCLFENMHFFVFDKAQASLSAVNPTYH
ncbi:hypothetical protein BDF14DRAFT_1833567 [Spinellus fusiger]|nr:hypothetical protein BDF14DRAFT_1833567 [Spinellus fusiger]